VLAVEVESEERKNEIAMNKRAAYAQLAGAIAVFDAHSFAGMADGNVAIHDLPPKSLTPKSRCPKPQGADLNA